jgi:hypothetical protein
MALGLVGGAQCSFSPDLSGGYLRCATGTDKSCPVDYVCRPTGYCCKPDDTQAQCAGSVPFDGGLPDSTPTMDTLPAPPDVEPGMTLPPRRVLTGAMSLIGFDEACSHGIPASTPERWCGFIRGTELWVLNVSKAATTAVPCNGSDPSCRLLTNKLFLPASTTTKNGHTRAQFFGDLLIFYAEATQNIAADELFRGGVYAWHPSFTEPRRMTSAAGTRCESHPNVNAPSAWCEDVAPTGAQEIRGGIIVAGQPLPSLWIKAAPTDAHIVEVSRAGDRLVLMQRVTGGAPAVSLIPADGAADPTKRVLVAPAVWNFEQSVDGSLLYVVRDEGRKGGLFSVDMATGTKVTEIAPAIEGLSALRDDLDNDLGLVAYDGFASETANARLFLDRTMPTKSVALAGRVGGVALSPNKRFTLVSTQVVTTPRRLTDAKLIDTTTMGSCVLQGTATTDRHFPYFSRSSSLVYWSQPSAEPDYDNIWLATTSCQGKRAVTGQLLAFNTLANEGILYKQRDGVQKSSLHFQRFSPDTGATVVGPIQIYGEGVGQVALIEPERKLAVFTGLATGTEGLYVVDLP